MQMTNFKIRILFQNCLQFYAATPHSSKRQQNITKLTYGEVTEAVLVPVHVLSAPIKKCQTGYKSKINSVVWTEVNYKELWN